jgi:hypothetical protein
MLRYDDSVLVRPGLDGDDLTLINPVSTGLEQKCFDALVHWSGKEILTLILSMSEGIPFSGN